MQVDALQRVQRPLRIVHMVDAYQLEEFRDFLLHGWLESAEPSSSGAR
jgi:hypothetical protein